MEITPAGLGSITPTGDLRRRAELNFDRLEQHEYQLPAALRIATQPDYDWPADFEGRTILALTLLARATGREPRYLSGILRELSKRYNEQGYLGRVLADGSLDEQQMSGHSWLLRGLCEYYLWTHDQGALDAAHNIVTNLMLPAANCYQHYPIEIGERELGGAESGSLTGRVHGRWRLSTDIGCAFMPLDGVTQAYEILRTPELEPLIEATIARFLQVDLVATSFQTHATLTALRGILRYAETTGRQELLSAVERTYALYKAEARTENYENYNWFGRPEWTEPCAVIDSFIVAVSLWKHTGAPGYLEDAHHILFNGMGYEQRPSGGWGCNSCLGAADVFLAPDCYEAWWCCLMRGGEGLARATEYLYFTDNDRVFIPFYGDNFARLAFTDGSITVRQSTDYPVGGNVRLEIAESSVARPIRFSFFAPEWLDRAGLQLTINGRPADVRVSSGFVDVEAQPRTGDTIELAARPVFRSLNTIGAHTIEGYHTFRHGPLLLGTPNHGDPIPCPAESESVHLGDARYQVQGSGLILSPLSALIDLPDADARSDRKQVLFR